MKNFHSFPVKCFKEVKGSLLSVIIWSGFLISETFDFYFCRTGTSAFAVSAQLSGVSWRCLGFSLQGGK